jgi:hypothetical protein
VETPAVTPPAAEKPAGEAAPDAAKTETTKATPKKSVKKKAAKKSGAKKKAPAKKKVSLKDKNLNAGKKPAPAPNLPDSPEDISEPSETITAIKSKAEKIYWDGQRSMQEQAQGPSKESGSLRRISASEVAGVTFDDQPLRMASSEAFRRSLETISFELGRPCKRPEEKYFEYLGWPLQQTEQSRVDAIFQSTNEKFNVRGFSMMPHRPRSAARDVSVFTASRAEKSVLGLWSAGDVGLLLLMCETEGPPVAQPVIAEEKKPVKKSKKKGSKKTVPPVEESVPQLPEGGGSKPVVQPGMPPRSAPANAPSLENTMPAPPVAPGAAPVEDPGAAFVPADAPPPAPAASTPGAPIAAPPAVPTTDAPAPKEEEAILPPVQ